MEKLSNGCKDCIEKFIMASHGGRDNFATAGVAPTGLRTYIHTWHPDPSYPEGGYYTDDLWNVPGSRDVRVDLQNSINRKQVNFCDKCEIYVYACWVGYRFLLELAEVTGCKINNRSVPILRQLGR